MKKAFCFLKNKLTSPDVLGVPDFNLFFFVEPNASSISLGAFVRQKRLRERVRSRFGVLLWGTNV